MVTDHMHPVWILNRQPVSVEMAFTLWELIAKAPIFMLGPGTWIPHLPMEIDLAAADGDGTETFTLLDPVVNAIAEESVESLYIPPASTIGAVA